MIDPGFPLRLRRLVACAFLTLSLVLVPALLPPLVFGMGARAEAAVGRVAVVSLRDEARDAFRGPLAPALAPAPDGVEWVRLDPCPPDALPVALDTVGATGAVWARLRADGAIGLRWYRRHPSELFEVDVPRIQGSPSALAEAVRHRLQFLMEAPRGTGRPWPSLPPVEPPLAPELIAAFEAPPPRPWPPLPEIRLPNPPAPLPGPPPPQGEVEMVIEASPGAQAPPTMIFSPTAEHGAMARLAGRAAASPTPRAAPVGPPPTRLALVVDANLPTPWSVGGGFDLVLPTLGGDAALDLGVRGHFAHEPRDTEVPAGPPLASWRATAAFEARFSAEDLHLRAGGGPFLATLSRVGSARDMVITDAWQLGLAAGTRLGWDLGPAMPLLGCTLLASPDVLAARSEGTEPLTHVVAARVQFVVELGVALPLGR